MENPACIVAGIVIVVISIILIVRSKKRAARCSAAVSGVIVKVDREQQTDSEGRNTHGFVYTPHYSFVANGQQYTKKADYGTSSETMFVPGAPIDIVYNPADPRESMLAGKSKKASSAFGIMLLLFGLLLVVVGAVA